VVEIWHFVHDSRQNGLLEPVQLLAMNGKPLFDDINDILDLEAFEEDSRADVVRVLDAIARSQGLPSVPRREMGDFAEWLDQNCPPPGEGSPVWYGPLQRPAWASSDE
jgi:hypothetical protein